MGTYRKRAVAECSSFAGALAARDSQAVQPQAVPVSQAVSAASQALFCGLLLRLPAALPVSWD